MLAAGCDQSLSIPAHFPEPVIQPLPVNVGIYYPSALSEYTYSEKLPGESAWSIRIGEANVAMFNSVFNRLFRSTVRLTALPAGNMSTSGAGPVLDAIIEPTVAAFEFSLPAQSATDQYSVWIRYNLNVYGPDGALITTWPVSAYGQSDSRTLKPGQSMEEATVLAMRDAAATISLGFGEDAKVRAALLHEEEKSDGQK